MNHKRFTLIHLSVWLILAILVSSCNSAKEDKPQTLNVLCSARDIWCEGLKQEFEKRYDVEVLSLRLSTGEALARLREEKDDPQFDLWWGGPLDSYLVAKAEGLFAAYDSPNYANLTDIERFKDPDNQWAGIYVGNLGFCTNKNWLAANPGVEPPASWEDLLKPEFTGQIMMAHPSTSGTSYTTLSTLLQLKGDTEGWTYMEQLASQVMQFTRVGLAPATFVAGGEAAVCINFAHDILQMIVEEDAPLVLTFPAEGTGYEIGGMAIIQGAKNLSNAQKWFDWMLTAETQALGPKYSAYPAPTVKDVPMAFPEMLEASLIDYDLGWSAENKTALVERFTSEIATADNLRE